MPTTSLPSPALVSTCESATAPLTAELTSLFALSTAELARLWASLLTLCPALTTLLAALATELAGVVGVLLLPQPVTTSASAVAPATADAILASLIR